MTTTLNNFLLVGMGGSPRTGKSSCIRALEELCSTIQYPNLTILTIPEAASRVIREHPELDNTTIDFQNMVFEFQQKDIAKAQAYAMNHADKKVLVFMDRTPLDAWIYHRWDADQFYSWNSCAKEYSKIFYFALPLDNEDMKKNNEFRKETDFQQLIDLDKIGLEVYLRFANTEIVPAFHSVEQKIEYFLLRAKQTIFDFVKEEKKA